MKKLLTVVLTIVFFVGTFIANNILANNSTSISKNGVNVYSSDDLILVHSSELYSDASISNSNGHGSHSSHSSHGSHSSHVSGS